MKISVGISMRHVHLTEEDYNILFNEPLTEKSPLNQYGQYAANQQVIIRSNDRKIKNVRIIGPFRNYTQVEVSRTDAYYLKLNPPVRAAGDLVGAEPITIIGPKGEITREAAIVSDRHIHITQEDRKKYNLLENEYKVQITGEKSGTLGNIKIKEAPNSYFELHLDSDDANAFGIKQGDVVEIIK